MNAKLNIVNTVNSQVVDFVANKFSRQKNNFRTEMALDTFSDPSAGLTYPTTVSMRLVYYVRGIPVIAIVDETGWTGFHTELDRIIAVINIDDYEVVARQIAIWLYGTDECYSTCGADWFVNKTSNLPPCFCTDGHSNDAGGWCCPHVGNTCGHDHWWVKGLDHVVNLVEGTAAFDRHWEVDNATWLSYDGVTDCVTHRPMPKSVRDAIYLKNRELRG